MNTIITETIEKIYEKFENIQLFPGVGADLSKRVRLRTSYKYAVWNDYVIIYKVGKEYIAEHASSNFKDTNSTFIVARI